MPTLIEKNRITFLNRGMTPVEKERNGKVTAMEFMMDYYFTPYVPKTKRGDPMKKPTKMGDRIKVLRSATGSGKGSIPLELYVRYFEATRKNIATLQPTIATTVAIPYEVMEIPTYAPIFTMGENIGYQTGSFIKKPSKGVIFMTTGVIAQMLRVMSDEMFMRKFAFILLDEAHMRKVELDVVFFMLKKLVQRNIRKRECPFVMAMSATLPANKYADYFGTPREDVIDIPGQTYPKEAHYLDNPTPNYVKSAVNRVMDIHENMDDRPEKGDILIFVYGAGAMKDIEKLLNEQNKKTKHKFILSRIDSDAFRQGTSEYFNVIKSLNTIKVTVDNKEYTPTRRIILGTPAVETGLTLPSLKYCIETGYVRAVEYNPVFNVTINTPKPVSQSMAVQRVGRVGRKFPGVFYSMYTKEIFDAMDVDQKPDLYLQDISKLIMDLCMSATFEGRWDGNLRNDTSRIALGSLDVADIDLLDFPAVDSIMSAQEKLYSLGFVDHNLVPTKMGMASSFFRLNMENIRMMFEGYIVGANIADLITIAAILESDPSRLFNTQSKFGPVYKPVSVFGSSGLDEIIKKSLFISCDVIERLLAYYTFMNRMDEVVANKESTSALRDWAFNNGFVYNQWLYVITARDSILNTFVTDVGLDPTYNGLNLRNYDLLDLFKNNIDMAIDEVKKIKNCLYEGYRLQTATWSENDMAYIHDYNHMKLKMYSPVMSPLPEHDAFEQRRPNRIIAYDVTLSLPGRSKDGAYIFSSSMSTVLDGHVNVDDTYITS